MDVTAKSGRSQVASAAHEASLTRVAGIPTLISTMRFEVHTCNVPCGGCDVGLDIFLLGILPL
jgi:hypothetical protein